MRIVALLVVPWLAGVALEGGLLLWREEAAWPDVLLAFAFWMGVCWLPLQILVQPLLEIARRRHRLSTPSMALLGGALGVPSGLLFVALWGGLAEVGDPQLAFTIAPFLAAGVVLGLLLTGPVEGPTTRCDARRPDAGRRREGPARK